MIATVKTENMFKLRILKVDYNVHHDWLLLYFNVYHEIITTTVLKTN